MGSRVQAPAVLAWEGTGFPKTAMRAFSSTVGFGLALGSESLPALSRKNGV